MSNNDSFIEEVSEEVRRDRVYALVRRYGWIAALAVFALVGGAAWNEYSKAQARAQAETLGDAILAALEESEPEARATALAAIETESPGGSAVVALLSAGQNAEAGSGDAAMARLEEIASNPDLPEIYRNIAGFKALLAGAETLGADMRQQGFEGLARPGNPLRLLAEEQIALIEIETGAPEEARARLERIVEDSEVSVGLSNRARQMIVALGGPTPGT